MSSHHACPSCNSDQWKALSLVYEEGLSDVNSSTSTYGVVARPSGLGGAVIGTDSDTEGVVQSALSQRAAPPLPPKNTAMYVALVFGVLTLVLLFFSGYLACLFTLVVALFALAKGMRNFERVENEKLEFPKKLKAWKARRMCLRCGGFYDPVSKDD